MVHIKKLEIFGFKSFGYKNTVVNFDPGLVAISGPNGSGKSNILDAITFALGENSPKIMRVDKLRSLLHDVENKHHGTKIARVSCHFDNSDRKIPVDSNTVSITREMDETGENVYYINQKKIQRNHLLDLLEVANAGIHKLNIVQQGTITRISEFNAEERRKIIEDIIGLAYFDEKKTESLKQLDEADRRLEIALARMDEIKKRIDELEAERNHQLRYIFLEQELGRFHAVQASNKLREIESQKVSKERNLNALNSDTKKLEEQRDAIKTEIKNLEDDKQKFMEEVNAYNVAKASIDSDLSKAIQLSENANSKMATSSRRISQIDLRLPEIESELGGIQEKRTGMDQQISQIKVTVKSLDEKKKSVNNELSSIDSEIHQVLKQQSYAATNRVKIDDKIKNLTTTLNDTKFIYSKTSSEKTDTENKIVQNENKIKSFESENEKLKELSQKLQIVKTGHEEIIKELKSRLAKMTENYLKIEKDIEENSIILEKASKAAAEHETKIRVVKEVMHEDYSIAKLKEDSKRLGIQGLVYEVLSWEKQYERPILAVGSDWLKSLVVNDFATLLGLTEFAQEKKLPKIKIIPLDAIPNSQISIPPELGVLGLLSDFIKCSEKFEALRNFIFGKVILVESKESAYSLSKKGYKAVTVDGKFFEADTNAVVVDINSKISKFTKVILLSTSVDEIIHALGLLKKFIQEKKLKLKKIERIKKNLEERYSSSEIGLNNVELHLTDIKAKIKIISNTEEQISSRILQLRRHLQNLSTNISKLESHISSVEDRINITKENYENEEQIRIANILSTLNEKKSNLLYSQTSILNQLREIGFTQTECTNEENSLRSQGRTLHEEQSRLKHEKDDLEAEIRVLSNEKDSAESNLLALRTKEQELISTSGTSVSRLKEYDNKLREQYDSEKSLTKEINGLERQSDSITRDLNELNANEVKIKNTMVSYGYMDLLDTFDVDQILTKLENEKKILSGTLNTKAPEAFVEISNGYRSMSTRKNELEEERNSIVKFIEEIDKDKRQTFLEAYDKVDQDIRKVFNTMTGGNAWLEIQNEDDIFNSGISYLIQFPDKQKRESTSISGGEKTLAAITFLLALQTLKPSPFYLLDEVDAHLDALNTERISKILVERSIGNQIIMVTLKDSTVQKAQLIYGVYPKNGVSQVVTYKHSNTQQIAN